MTNWYADNSLSIGRTPLVRLNRIVSHPKARILAKIEGRNLTIAIIPHTTEATNLKSLKPGDPVNLETDIIAKYVEKMMGGERVQGAMDLILSQELGNSAATIVKHRSLRPGTLLLESLFVMRVAAPKESQVERYFPPTVIRVIVDHQLNEWGAKLGKELLSAPARLALTHDKPAQWPAWNMDWQDMQKPPRAYVGGPATVKIVENGPARVALEVAREADGSRFVQTIRLGAGDAGNRVEFALAMDWKTPETNLKAAFPLSAGNPKATYNWDIGTLQRASAEPFKFEVPSHQWVDLTDRSGGFGVTMLTGAKNGSDKPNDNTLRLTLVRTPGVSEGWEDYGDQSTQDFGHHELVYGIAAHQGDWRQEHTPWQAWAMDQPLVAFQSPKHEGALGRDFSLLGVNNPSVRVLALKKAEASDEIVVRVVETDGLPQQGVRIAFAQRISGAREPRDWRETRRRRAICIGGFWSSGRMPMPTSPSCGQPEESTRRRVGKRHSSSFFEVFESWWCSF